MGVLYDYFRVPDDQAAVALMDSLGGGPVVQYGHKPVVDAVDAKGIDPSVLLAQLIALARGIEWDLTLADEVAGTDSVWPARDAVDMEHIEEYDGAGVVRLGDTARDTLAGIADESIPNLAARWAQAEEFWGTASAEDVRPVVADLVGLARRAADTGDHLYCWMSL